MTNPLVSIITPTYNSELFISKTIKSVIDQSYNNWELLITDDFSTDKTISIVKGCSKRDDRIKLFCLSKNNGAGVARNNSIIEAKGKYIAFLDSDDLWHPKKLEIQIGYMEDNNLNFSFSSYFIIDSNGTPTGKTIKALKEVDYSKMLNNNYIGCLTAVYNADALGKTKMPLIRKRQDWGLWLKILSKTDCAKSIDEPLAYYREGNNSLSSNKISLVKSNFEFYRNHLKFSFIKSIFMIPIFLVSYLQYKVQYKINSDGANDLRKIS